CEGNEPLRRRMMELGMTEGTRISVRRLAPLGDPIMVHLRGSALSIRRSDARWVEVE
ncbi:MAG: FeoA family protein, partial [Planctomycetia bacterium]|nr:FeoA family protein [Planctomycetia bacterium]